MPFESRLWASGWSEGEALARGLGNFRAARSQAPRPGPPVPGRPLGRATQRAHLRLSIGSNGAMRNWTFATCREWRAAPEMLAPQHAHLATTPADLLAVQQFAHTTNTKPITRTCGKQALRRWQASWNAQEDQKSARGDHEDPAC